MPFLGTTELPIQFTGGLNSKVSDFVLDQPFLQEAVNIRFNELGKLDKRPGFTAVPNDILGGGNVFDGYKLTTYNSTELCLFDGSSLFSFDDQNDVWVPKGSAFYTETQQIRVLNTKIFTQSNPDAITADNLTLYAWEDNRIIPATSSGVRYSIIDNNTELNVVSDQIAYIFGTRPKTIAADGYFYLFYNAAVEVILYNKIPVSKPNTTLVQFGSVCDDAKSVNPTVSSIPYDVVVYNNAPLVCYASQTGVKFASPALTLNARTDIKTIGMCVDSNNTVWVSYSSASNTYVMAFVYDGGWITLLQETLIETTSAVNLALIEDISTGALNLTAEFALTGNNNFIDNYLVQLTGTVTLVGQQRGVGLASKPFKHGKNIFINTVFYSVLQATYFTICLTKGFNFLPATNSVQAANNNAIATTFTVVSKHSPQNGGTYRTNSILSECSVLSNNNFLFAGQRKGAFTSFIDSQTTNLGIAGYTIKFNTTNAFNNVTANSNLHIAGGVKKIYDGISVVEDNFNYFPELADGYGCDIELQTGVDGQLTYNALFDQNLYQYCVVYEWSDNYQQVQRSTPSVVNSIQTTTTGQAGNLTVPTLRLTDKTSPRSPVAISIYRTVVNGSIFYKITDDNNPLINDHTVDTLTYLDVLSDDDIQSNENLYTSSQLENTAPPPCSIISLFQNRVVITNSEDPNTVWYTQNKFDLSQYNTLALDWNTQFVEGISNRIGAGAVTALGFLDQNLVIFKENSIFILQGDGPNPLNTSGQFNDAQPIVSDTGCINQNSLVYTPNGLLFKSGKGIYLLGRDTSLEYIGAPVEKYNYLTITSASLLAHKNEVWFTSQEGICLVYNYYFKAWTTAENVSAISGTIWKNKLCVLNTTGGSTGLSVMIQDNDDPVYVDTFANGITKNVQTTIKFPWIKPMGQLQGRAAVYNFVLLGMLQGPHILQVEVAYNYNHSIMERAEMNSNIAGAGRWGGNPTWGNNIDPGFWGQTNFANYQFQYNFKYPRGFYGDGIESIQITLTDVNATGNAGYSLNGMTFEINPLSGNMQPGGNRFSGQ